MNEVSGTIQNGTLVINISGHIDSNNIPQVEKDISELMNEGQYDRIVIDAQELEYISSAGLRVMLRIRKQNEKLKLINVNTEVYEILDMTGFTQLMDVEKAYREISIEGCKPIARGANGTLYRIDQDNVVKVYEKTDALTDIQHERECARTALVLGIPTAISYDIVRVGNSYGSVFELLDAQSFAQILISNPEKTDWCIEEFTDMLIRIHSTKVPDKKLPDMKKTVQKWVAFLKDHLPPESFDKLRRLVNAVPASDHMIHGDYHFKNLMLQNDEVLLIDMDTLATGHPVFELGSMYNAFKGFSEYNHGQVKEFMGFDFDTSCRAWHRFLSLYLGTEDEDAIREVEDKARIIGYTRLIRRGLRRNYMDTPDGRAQIELWTGELIELLNRTDSLFFLGNSIEIAAKRELLPEILEFLEAHLEAAFCAAAIVQKINIVVEEIFVNISNYAYRNITGTARISIKMEGDMVSIAFIDSGAPFNPLEKEDPDISLSAQEREVGGLGIFLVKKIMDEVTYQYRDGKNILTVKKRIRGLKA